MKIKIEKNVYKNWVSIKGFKEIPKILFPFYKLYYKFKGYEVIRSDDIESKN